MTSLLELGGWPTVGHVMLHEYLVGGCTTTQYDVSQWRHVTKISASKINYRESREVWSTVLCGNYFHEAFNTSAWFLCGKFFQQTHLVKPQNSGKISKICQQGLNDHNFFLLFSVKKSEISHFEISSLCVKTALNSNDVKLSGRLLISLRKKSQAGDILWVLCDVNLRHVTIFNHF